LKERGLGLTQAETATRLGTTRANVSMLESRAKKNLEKARDTLKAYELTVSSHSIRIAKGTKVRDIPPIVLREGDRWGIHLKANLVDIVRLARSSTKASGESGTVMKDLTITIMQNGKVTAS